MATLKMVSNLSALIFELLGAYTQLFRILSCFIAEIIFHYAKIMKFQFDQIQMCVTTTKTISETYWCRFPPPFLL